MRVKPSNQAMMLLTKSPCAISIHQSDVLCVQTMNNNIFSYNISELHEATLVSAAAVVRVIKSEPVSSIFRCRANDPGEQ